jgi:hypothetical protein
MATQATLKEITLIDVFPLYAYSLIQIWSIYKAARPSAIGSGWLKTAENKGLVPSLKDRRERTAFPLFVLKDL